MIAQSELSVGQAPQKRRLRRLVTLHLALFVTLSADSITNNELLAQDESIAITNAIGNSSLPGQLLNKHRNSHGQLVEDWFLSVDNKKKQLAIGEHIVIGSPDTNTYIFGGRYNNKIDKLVFIADEFTINGFVQLYALNMPHRRLGLSASADDRRGGDVYVICRTLNFNINEKLKHSSLLRVICGGTFWLEGDEDPFRGANGGKVAISAESLLFQSKRIKAEELVKPVVPVELLSRTTNPGVLLSIENAGDTAQDKQVKGQDGEVILLNGLSDRLSRDVGEELSIWKLEMLNYLEFKLREARRTANEPEIGRLLRKYKFMPDWPTTGSYWPSINKALIRVQSVADSYKLITWREKIIGDQIMVDLALEGPDIRLRAFPSLGLILPKTIGGHSVLGYLQLDQGSQDQATITLDARLTIDPWVANLLDQQLGVTHETREGLFMSWEPRPSSLNITGLIDIRSHLFGDSLQLELKLDLRRAGPVLWRLSSVEGLPLEFDWVYSGDPSIKGQRPIVLPLSLARRARHDLAVGDGKLTNGGRWTATIEYVQFGPGRFARPRRSNALVLKTGESAALSAFDLPAETDLSKVTVAPEAVTVEVGPDPFEDFQRDPGLLETVTVRNLLPAHDDIRQTDLRFVEVRVVQVVGEGGDAVHLAPAGPFRLAPRGADGAEVTVPFLKPGTKPRKYRLEGTAYYQGAADSKDILKPTTTEGTSVDITDAVLPGR